MSLKNIESVEDLLAEMDATKSAATEAKADAKKASDDQTKVGAALLAKLKSAETLQGETKAEVDKLAENFATKSEAIDNHLKEYDVLNGRVDAMKTSLDALLEKGSNFGSGQKSDTERHERAVKFYEQRYIFSIKADDQMPDFNPSVVTEDKVAEFEHYEKGFHSILRSKGDYNVAFSSLTSDQQKAVNSITNGNHWFLPPEFSNRVIQCGRYETSILGMYDNVTMSGSELIVPIDPIEGGDAIWACDDSCESGDTGIENMGELTLKPHELRSDACLSKNMVDDSAFDIEGRVAANVARSFERAKMRATLQGDGIQKPQGSLMQGNHVPMLATGADGGISYNDIRCMPLSFPGQFQNGAVWMGDCKTLATIAKLKKPDGSYYLDQIVRDTNGRPIIEGFPYYTVDQMGAMCDAEGNLIEGSVPLAFTNPFEHYMFATRMGMEAFRDPYSKSRCRYIVWRFTGRFDGQVKCANAFSALQIGGSK